MRKISYHKLWDMLEKRNIPKNKLRLNAKLSSSSFSKLINDQNVTTDTLIRICNYLKCDINQIICCIEDEDEIDE